MCCKPVDAPLASRACRCTLLGRRESRGLTYGVDERMTEPVFIEEAMHIRADDESIVTNGSVESCQSVTDAGNRRKRGTAMNMRFAKMNFISSKICRGQRHLPNLLTQQMPRH